MPTNNSTIKLNFIRILSDAFHISWQKRTQLARVLAIPLFLLITINTFFANQTNITTVLLLLLIELLVYTVFAVNYHKIILLEQPSPPFINLPKWSATETRFLGWVIGICTSQGIAVGVITALLYASTALSPEDNPMGIIFQPIFIIATMPVFYLLARLSLIFPATAINKHPDLRWAFSFTQGNGWQLLLIIWLIPACNNVASHLVIGVDSTFAEEFALSIFNIFTLSIEICALSLAYKTLSSKETDKLTHSKTRHNLQ